MATFSSTTEKPIQKRSQVLPSNYHLADKYYFGCIHIGGDNYYTEYFATIEEAQLELRCLEKRLNYELIETVESEGFYPHRAILMEEMYQQSGRTSGLYTGLYEENGALLNNGTN